MNLLRLAAALSLVAITTASYAQSPTAIDAGSIYAGFLPYLLAVIGAVVSTLVGWVLVSVQKRLGISMDDSMRNSLQTAATNAAGLVLNKLGNSLNGKTVDVKNQFVAEAVNYVLKAAPDAINHFGLTPEAIAQKIVALLPQVANTTTTATTVK